MAKGGGGGGSSGKVDFPDYMKTWHGDVLDDGGSDTVTYSITDAMIAAYGNSPYSGESAFDPSSEILAINTALSSFSNAIDVIDGIVENIDTAAIEDAVEAFANERDNYLIDIIIPRFKGGMRDINAVMTSAFVVGGAIIEASSARDIAKFDADLRLNDVSTRVQKGQMRSQLETHLLHYTIDANRIAIVANKERADKDLEIDQKDALWDLESFQYGANFLGSISGSAVSTKDIDAKGSVLGGALSGAAAGAMTGSTFGPWGTAIGAGIGGLLGAMG